jgi:hypothetical protein
VARRVGAVQVEPPQRRRREEERPGRRRAVGHPDRRGRDIIERYLPATDRRPSKVISKAFKAAFVRREALLFEWR